MKRTFVFLLLAAAAAVRTAAMNATPEAEPSAETNYAEGNDDKKKTPTQQLLIDIDGEIIENFDGSQLIGKTILNYTVSPCGVRHRITTTRCATVKAQREWKLQLQREGKKILLDHDEKFYIYDGKIYADVIDFPELPKDRELESIKEIKYGEDLFKKYLNEAKNVPGINVEKIISIYVVTTKPKSKK